RPPALRRGTRTHDRAGPGPYPVRMSGGSLRPYRPLERGTRDNTPTEHSMSDLDTVVARRPVLKAFLIGGPTLAVGLRLGLATGAGAFPTRTDEVPDVVDFTDIFLLSEQPSAYDLKIEIRPDNRVYLEGPR